MLTLTCCQDHILTENIWFVRLETSYSGDERRCHGCGTNNRTLKIELLSQWKLEAEFRNSICISRRQVDPAWWHCHSGFLGGNVTQALAQGRIHSEFGRISRLSRVATKMACKHGGLAHGNVKGTYLDIVNFNCIFLFVFVINWD